MKGNRLRLKFLASRLSCNWFVSNFRQIMIPFARKYFPISHYIWLSSVYKMELKPNEYIKDYIQYNIKDSDITSDL